MLRAAILFAIATVIPAARSSETAPSSAPKKTVAILYFDNNTGKADYDPLGRGIASMMISDLSVVKEIQLVERERMQDLLKEIENQQTKYFDSTTSVKVGKMMGAEFVVVGSFATAQPQIRIDTRVVRVETGEIMKTAQVVGHEDKFFDLEQKLADRLIDGLGIALSPEEQEKLKAQQEANRIEALATMREFSRALQLYDKKDYEAALKPMAAAAQGAPNSMLVRVAYADMKRRASAALADKAKDKIKSGIGGLIKRPPR
jgi:TolB-like protein